MQGDDRLDVSAHVEVGDDLQEGRFKEGFQFPEKCCSRFFMGDGPVSKAVQIELEGFEFDDKARRTITDMDCGKIRISGPGAETGEFRIGYPDLKRRLRFRSRPFFQQVFLDGNLPVGHLPVSEIFSRVFLFFFRRRHRFAPGFGTEVVVGGTGLEPATSAV